MSSHVTNADLGRMRSGEVTEYRCSIHCCPGVRYKTNLDGTWTATTDVTGAVFHGQTVYTTDELFAKHQGVEATGWRLHP